MLRGSSRIALLAVSTVLAAVPAAFAQSQGQGTAPNGGRGYRGLFGGNQGSSTSGQSLNVSFSAGSAYDDNVLGRGGAGSVDSRFQKSGVFSFAQAGIAYANQSDRFSITAFAGTGMRFTPSVDNDVLTGHSAFVGMSAALGTHSRIQASQSFSYAPYYSPRILISAVDRRLPNLASNGELELASTAEPLDSDFAVTSLRTYRYATSVSFSHELSARSSIDFLYNLNRSVFRNADRDLSAQRAAIRYGYQLTRYARFHAGYGYRVAQYDLTATRRPLASHDIDLGVDYSRALSLSLSRRTTLSLGSGSSVIVRDRVEEEHRTSYRLLLVGNVLLSHDIGRSWYANAGYHRGLRFVEGFSDPLIADSVTGGVGGYLGRRINVVAGAAHTRGTVGLTNQRRGHSGSNATARIQFALFRYLALYSQYVYYRYHFQEGVDLPPGFAPALERQGVRVGLSAWFPLIG